MTTSRRRFLRAALAGMIGSLSGCSSPTASDPPATMSATATSDRTTDAGPDLTARARQFVADLDRGAFEAASEAFVDGAERLPPRRLQRLWMGLTAQLGPYRRTAGTDRSTDGDREVVEATLVLADGRQRARLAFTDRGSIVDLSFPATYDPPAYADAAAFEERETTVAVDCELGGSVCLPSGSGTVPGAVFVHGTGAHDRDESVGPNRPFQDLAWGLATRGVATLRYEKRTYGCTVPPADQTVDNVVVEDASEAVSVLSSHDRVGRVAVVGHSLGATLAPRIATTAGADGAAMLAAAARPLTTLIRDQVEYITTLDGTVTDREALVRERVDRQVERVEAGDYGDGDVLLGFSGAFWRTFREYDPVAAAREFDGPEAFLQGGRDYQVSPGADFGRFQRALDGRADATFRRYDPLDHLFMPGHGPSLPEEYRFPDHVSRRVVEDLAAWLGDLETA